MEGHPIKQLRRARPGLGDDSDDDLEAMQAAFLSSNGNGGGSAGSKHRFNIDHDGEDVAPAEHIRPAARLFRATAPPPVVSAASVAAAKKRTAGTPISVPAVVPVREVQEAANPAATVEDAPEDEPEPVPAPAPTPVAPAPAKAKKKSLFAQRRAATTGTGTAAAAGPVDPSAPKPAAPVTAAFRERLPPVEAVTASVIKGDIAERTGATGPKSDLVQFPSQATGFPMALHRSVAFPMALHRSVAFPAGVAPARAAAAAAGPAKPKIGEQLAAVLAPAPTLAGEELEVHHESMRQLEGMSETEIEEAQQQYLTMLDPAIVAMLQKRAAAKYAGSVEPASNSVAPEPEPASALPPIPEPTEVAEKRKLEWTRDVSSRGTPADSDPVASRALDPNDPLTQAPDLAGSNHRFDFAGRLLARGADVPTYLGLHHHGDNADAAGYTVPELVHLFRSAVAAQRQISVRTLGRIVGQLWAGAYPVETHNEVLRLIHDSLAIIHTRNLLDDNNVSVLTEALATLSALLEVPDTLAAPADPWSGAHVVALDRLVHLPDEEATLHDHASMIRLNVPDGLVSTKIVHRLGYLIAADAALGPADKTLALVVLLRLCEQSRKACQQVSEDTRLVAAMFAMLAVPWPRVDADAADRASLVLDILRVVTLHSVAFANTHRGALEAHFLKFLALPTAAESAHAHVFTAAARLAVTLYSYGVDVLVQETCQLLFEQRCAETRPAMYAIARAIRVHLPDLAILTVPIVDDAYLEVKQLGTPAPAAAAASSDAELLSQALQLIASRRVAAPVADLVTACQVLCDGIVDALPMACDEEDGGAGEERRDHFAVFPATVHKYAAPLPAEVHTRVQALAALLRNLPDEDMSTLAALDVVGNLFRTVFRTAGAQLGHVAALAPLGLVWLQYAAFDKPLDHLVAYATLTFLPVPMEPSLRQLAEHLAHMEPAAGLGNPWEALETVLLPNLVEPKRDSLFVVCDAPTLERAWSYPQSILSRPWLAKAAAQPATSAAAIGLLVRVAEWHAELGATAIPWIVPSDLFPVFGHPDAPYLDPALGPALTTIALAAGVHGLRYDEAAATQFDELVDAYTNVSFHAAPFQAFLAATLFGSAATAAHFRSQFLTTVRNARGLAQLTLPASTPGLPTAEGTLLEANDDEEQAAEQLHAYLSTVANLPAGSVWRCEVLEQIRVHPQVKAGGTFAGELAHVFAGLPADVKEEILS
ncbi:hypothetical protein H9P43_003386 [Blastocladiella emersonii ATCC 22665]|nr:hypothetical protein H9P43_003386 [Blastocladiella emersonii ATCC 22665]